MAKIDTRDVSILSEDYGAFERSEADTLSNTGDSFNPQRGLRSVRTWGARSAADGDWAKVSILSEDYGAFEPFY